MIDRLEAKGWVERRTQNGDRRIKRIYLTREAERVHKRIWRVAEVTVDDALVNLSAQESAQLRKLLARVKRGLVVVVDGAKPTKDAAATTGSKPILRRTRRHNGSAAR